MHGMATGGGGGCAATGVITSIRLIDTFSDRHLLIGAISSGVSDLCKLQPPAPGLNPRSTNVEAIRPHLVRLAPVLLWVTCSFAEPRRRFQRQFDGPAWQNTEPPSLRARISDWAIATGYWPRILRQSNMLFQLESHNSAEQLQKRRQVAGCTECILFPIG